MCVRVLVAVAVAVCGDERGARDTTLVDVAVAVGARVADLVHLAVPEAVPVFEAVADVVGVSDGEAVRLDVRDLVLVSDLDRAAEADWVREAAVEDVADAVDVCDEDFDCEPLNERDGAASQQEKAAGR